MYFVFNLFYYVFDLCFYCYSVVLDRVNIINSVSMK